jgi:hypothetical protein
MAYSALTERLISIKKLSGKAQTSNDKGLINEGLPSGLTVSFETVFGERIPTNTDQSSDALYKILTASGLSGNGQVEYVRFPATFIAGTVNDAGGRQGFELKLPADYESNSKNPLAGTYPYKNNQIVNITSGALQMVPPSFATGFEARPFYGGTSSKDSGDRIYLTDVRDWYLDYFNGIMFQQDPPGAGDHASNPDYVQGYLYIGNYLSGTIANAGAGGSGNPAGSNTQVQFNNAGSFGASGNFTFNSTTNSLKVTSISGSLTHLVDGTSYLIAGDNISITSASNGSVTIAGGNSFSRQKVAQKQNTNILANQNVTITGLNMSTGKFDPSYIDVFVNGQMLVSGTTVEALDGSADYTATGNDTIKFSFDVENEDIISVLVFPKG